MIEYVKADEENMRKEVQEVMILRLHYTNFVDDIISQVTEWLLDMTIFLL